MTSHAPGYIKDLAGMHIQAAYRSLQDALRVMGDYYPSELSMLVRALSEQIENNESVKALAKKKEMSPMLPKDADRVCTHITGLLEDVRSLLHVMAKYPGSPLTDQIKVIQDICFTVTGMINPPPKAQEDDIAGKEGYIQKALPRRIPKRHSIQWWSFMGESGISAGLAAKAKETNVFISQENDGHNRYRIELKGYGTWWIDLIPYRYVTACDTTVLEGDVSHEQTFTFSRTAIDHWRKVVTVELYGEYLMVKNANDVILIQGRVSAFLPTMEEVSPYKRKGPTSSDISYGISRGKTPEVQAVEGPQAPTYVRNEHEVDLAFDTVVNATPEEQAAYEAVARDEIARAKRDEQIPAFNQTKRESNHLLRQAAVLLGDRAVFSDSIRDLVSEDATVGAPDTDQKPKYTTVTDEECTRILNETITNLGKRLRDLGLTSEDMATIALSNLKAITNQIDPLHCSICGCSDCDEVDDEHSEHCPCGECESCDNDKLPEDYDDNYDEDNEYEVVGTQIGTKRLNQDEAVLTVTGEVYVHKGIIYLDERPIGKAGL